MLILLQLFALLLFVIMYFIEPAKFISWYSRFVEYFISDTPFDGRHEAFPMARKLEANWKRIRDELLAGMQRDQTGQKPVLLNKSVHGSTLAVKALNHWVSPNAGKFPFIVELLKDIPQVTAAYFQILDEGQHIPTQTRLFKGVLSYHLPLVALPGGQNFIVCGDVQHDWKEGEGLLVDETFPHALWNNSGCHQIILVLTIVRTRWLPRWMRPLNLVIHGLIVRSRHLQQAIRQAEKGLMSNLDPEPHSMIKV